MRMQRWAALATAGVVALALSGCDGGDEVQRIASDTCEVMERVADEGFEAFDEEMLAELQALQERADETGATDAEMEQAIRDECPEVFEALQDMES